MSPIISKKHLLRQFFSMAAYYSGSCLLTRKGGRILGFHGINASPTNQYAVTAADFEKQMEYLAKHYQVIAVDEMVQRCQHDRDIPKGLVAVTVDDAFEDFYIYAYPVLKRLGIPATVFVPTGPVDREPNSASKLPQKEFLTWEQIREMAQNGIRFGSHTVSHESLTRLTQEEVRYELTHSKVRLEAELGGTVNGFCYPYGTFRDKNGRIEARVAEAGYVWAVTAISGVNKKGMNPFEVRRTVIVREDGLAGFRRVLKGSLDGWIVMQKIWQLVDRIKTANRQVEWGAA